MATSLQPLRTYVLYNGNCFSNSLVIILGRQVIAVARTADLVLMMLDATKKDVHRHLLEKELESVGIRLNKNKPNIYFKVNMFYLLFNFTVIISVYQNSREVTACNRQGVMHNISFQVFKL